LLSRRDPLLVLQFGLDLVNGIESLDVKGNGLASQSLHKDLHVAPWALQRASGRFATLAKGNALVPGASGGTAGGLRIHFTQRRLRSNLDEGADGRGVVLLLRQRMDRGERAALKFDEFVSASCA
jgi:hypothetical protein